MNRIETIDRITERLGTVDDTTLDLISDLVSEPLGRTVVRELTLAELAEVADSKADFAAGKSLSLDELNTFLDTSAAARQSARRA
jgi:hypothetical protein